MPGTRRRTLVTTHTLPHSVRRIIVRFATVVCPPELQTDRLIAPLLAEFARYLAALPPHVRLGLLAAFVLFDQRARLFGPAQGRRFAALDPARADAYFRHLAHHSGVGDRALAQLLKGLVTLCYYELPAVQARIGYRPAPYIAGVARRRLATYGDAIRRGEAAVFADDGDALGEGPP